jgi:hypothetical protein
MSGYVAADASRLTDLRLAVARAESVISTRRGTIAGLFAASGEMDVVSPALARIEAELSQTGCEIAAAAEVAAADAASGGQTGWRASLGMVDDVALDLFFVNDLSRALRGRDLNTGAQVGTGERVASGIFLIPFAKLAKATKLLKFGDDVADAASAAGAARRAARPTGLLAARESAIESWLRSSSRRPLTLTGPAGEITGRFAARGSDEVIDVSGVRTVLVRDASLGLGYRIQTAFPVPHP